MNAIQILKTKYELPIDVATEHGHQTSWLECCLRTYDLDMTDEQYIQGIASLANVDAAKVLEDIKLDEAGAHRRMPRYLFNRLVEVFVRAYAQGQVVEITDVYEKSVTHVKKYLTNPDNQCHWATGEDENAPPKLDSNGNIQPKKGDKKIMAKKVYEDQIKGKGITRKEAIALLVKEVGLTEAGASTYYSNLKNGVY